MAGAGGKQRRPGNPAKQKKYSKDRIKKPYARDVDQIVLNDMLAENMEKLLNQKIDEEKPGLGQHYCVPCARYFVTEKVLKEHLTGKQHKKRFKIISTGDIYTLEEANHVGGTFNPKFKKEAEDAIM